MVLCHVAILGGTPHRLWKEGTGYQHWPMEEGPWSRAICWGLESQVCNWPNSATFKCESLSGSLYLPASAYLLVKSA